MIRVNLLPEHLRIKKKDFNFPIFPLLILVFAILVIIYLALVIKISSHRQIVREMDEALLAVTTKSDKSQEAIVQLQEVTNIMDKVVYKSLIPTYSLTDIMNTINRDIPDGLWLTELNYYDDEEGRKLRLRGFVRPVDNQTMISVIGQLNNALKEYFEDLLKDQTTKSKEIDFSLTTKRRQAEKIEITEFSTVFTL